MVDILSVSQRSALMARVRGAGNASTELRLIAVFKASGITGWRRRWPLEGKPDFAFPKHRLVVFVDGCFWHGCPLHATQPKTNREFWREKIARNQFRDRTVTRTLIAGGWRVLRIWEHELALKNSARLFARLRRAGLLEAKRPAFPAPR
jgi:DNA mismatch endonuclease (patch repair protein)